MKITKKQIVLIACIVLGAAIVIIGTFNIIKSAKPFHKGDLSGTAEQFSITDREIKPLSVRDSGNFVVLQFTDTHLVSNKGKDAKTLAAMEEQIVINRPDLVVVTGDMLDGYNDKFVVNKQEALRAVAELFERQNQYWAYVPGNNDGEYLGSAADICAYLGRSYTHCLLSKPEGLTGAAQYVVPVKDAQGLTVHALIFMDSLARDPETNFLTYDCMKKDQADWLRDQLQQLKQDAPLAKASVFFHMNTPAFSQAQTDGEVYAEDYAKPDFPVSWAIRGNAIVDKVISSEANVGLVSIGHLHPKENWCAFYDNRYYHIARPSGYQATQRPGATLIVIHTYDGNPKRLYDFKEILF